MNPVYIALSSLALAVGLWLAWLLSRPCTKPLIDPQSQKALDDKLPPRCTEGNSTTVYTTFNPMLDALMDDIDSAQDHIHLLFFKFEADHIGQHIGNALATKVAQGVEVRLMYDDIVNHKQRWYYHTLADRGVQVQPFAPVHIPFLRKQDNYRNHRKVVVIDGHTGYLGGMNIAERYKKGLDWGPWRDTQMRIEGPAVAQLQHAFLADWCHATRHLPALDRYFPAPQPCGTQHIEIVTSGPLGPGPVIMHRTAQLLDQSRDYVYLESPYFIPTPEVMQALCSAARRGVDVRLLIPSRSDRGVFLLPASKSYVEQALDAGVRIGFFSGGFLHSKTIVTDDKVANISSANIDPRSYLLDLEIGAYVHDSEFALQLKGIFLADEAEAHYVDPERFKQRPLHEKLFERSARILSPQL
ncbi:MAG: cardiolipin synthase [Bacteroidales bacterium]|nr:cardiolipin synthase [Bacteroidales bacterium]